MGAERRILVVDDVAMFQEVESRFLASAGTVASAHSGCEALDLIRRERPQVVVTGFALPGMDGDALCKEIRTDPAIASTPVIVLVFTADERERAIRAGADDVLSKPIDRISLIRAVGRFLDSTDVRHLKRVEIEAAVTIRHDGVTFEGTILNISRGGAFVHTQRPPEPDAEIGLEIRMPEHGPTVATTARVRWRRLPAETGEGRPAAETGEGRPAAMGVQFLAMDNRSQRLVGAFVYERTPGRATT